MGWQGHEIQYYGFFPCFFNINNTSLKIIVDALSLFCQEQQSQNKRKRLSSSQWQYSKLTGVLQNVLTFLIVSYNKYYYNQ